MIRDSLLDSRNKEKNIKYKINQTIFEKCLKIVHFGKNSQFDYYLPKYFQTRQDVVHYGSK